jgi:hypothetical protein
MYEICVHSIRSLLILLSRHASENYCVTAQGRDLRQKTNLSHQAYDCVTAQGIDSSQEINLFQVELL